MLDTRQRSQRQRQLRLGAFVGVSALVAVVFASVMRGWGLSASVAAGLAIASTAPILLAALVFARVRWSGYYPGAATLRALTVLWAVPPAIVAGAICAGLLGLRPGFALLVGLAVGVVFAVRLPLQLGTATRRQMQRPVSLRNLSEADAMIRECRLALRDPSLAGDSRAAVSLNLARALIARSLSAGSSDGLVEATRIIEEVFRRPPPEPWLLFDAAHELVGAMSLKVEKHGDLNGYAEAVRLQLDVAAGLTGGAALTNAHDDLADFHLLWARRLGAEDPAGRRHYEAAIQSLEDGLRAAPRHSDLVPYLHVKLGAMVGERSLDLVDLNDGIEHCRTAQQLLAGHPVRDRSFLYVHLASLLAARAMTGAASAVADLDEAEASCQQVIDRGDPALRPAALETLTRILQVRDLR